MGDLPDNYDVIIVGTGMIESILAAALSRIGKTVLHLDHQEYYGENWASFNLENIEGWAETAENTPCVMLKDNFENLLNLNEKLISISRNSAISNVRLNKFVKESTNAKINKNCDDGDKEENDSVDDSTSVGGLQEKLKASSRKFNLDLCPKLLFSRGKMVELLISSNIAKYAEFKSLGQVLTWRNKQLEPVPCSRADVFATKNVSVVEKRILVKILTLFIEYEDNSEEFKGYEDKTFLEYLKHKKIPENLIHYILYAIAMGDNITPCLDGVKACKAFLQSLGRYGNTPFIFPMYGSGEIPQCFCRLCAVFGGIYCLNRGIEGLIVKDNKCVAVISDGVRLNTNIVILSSSFNLHEYSPDKMSLDISRGIFVTDGSILKREKESLTVLQFPPASQDSVDKPITVLELSPSTNTCPENFFVVHATAKAKGEASFDLNDVADSLFDSGEVNGPEASPVRKPRIIWSLTWNVSGREKPELPFENVKICSDVDFDLDYDKSINEAKSIFSELFPDEEFLPRAPDPDEIIFPEQEIQSDEKTDSGNNGETEAEQSMENSNSAANENHSDCDEKKETDES